MHIEHENSHKESKVKCHGTWRIEGLVLVYEGYIETVEIESHRV